MGNALEIVFWGVLTFSILVVLHEGGHFVAARAFGVKIHEFMVGLPGPRISIETKRTRYGITAIPLGGYVRIAGMEPGAEDELLAPALWAIATTGRMSAEDLSARLGLDSDRAGALLYTLSDWGAIEAASDDAVSYVPLLDADAYDDPVAMLDDARAETYRGLKTWQRVTVLVAGVTVNLLTAILVFTIVLGVWGYYQQSLTLEDVQSGYPAEEAGIRAGDTLVAIGDREIEQWLDLVQALAVAEPGTTAQVSVDRDGNRLTFPVTLGESPEGGAYLGIVAGVDKVDLTLFEAFRESLVWTGLVFGAIFSIFFNPELFAATVEGARSVVGISVEVAEAARTSPIDYAWWIALLSLSLGVMNLLPIPPLDGGKIVMELIERVIGKPIERRLSLAISLAGAVLLFSFIGYVMYADVMRYFVNG